jgi:hypothetical protein
MAKFFAAGEYPLHKVLRGPSPEDFVEALLHHGADPNVVDKGA